MVSELSAFEFPSDELYLHQHHALYGTDLWTPRVSIQQCERFLQQAHVVEEVMQVANPHCNDSGTDSLDDDTMLYEHLVDEHLKTTPADLEIDVATTSPGKELTTLDELKDSKANDENEKPGGPAMKKLKLDNGSGGVAQTTHENGEKIESKRADESCAGRTVSTILNEIARSIAYNVINFSYFPDATKASASERRWFIQKSQGLIGKDDESLAIVEALKTFEEEEGITKINDASNGSDYVSVWRDSKRIVAGVDLKTFKRIFEPAEGAGELCLLEERWRCMQDYAKFLGRWESKEAGFTCGLECWLRDLTKKSEVCFEKKSCRSTTATVSGDLQSQHSSTTSTPFRIDACIFIRELAKEIPPFRDLRIFASPQAAKHTIIEFSKRPQLTVSMLNADKLIDFCNIHDNFTVFSDYRLPQIFMSFGIFKAPKNARKAGTADRYPLSSMITSRTHIPYQSDEELALRCGTLVAAERLKKVLSRKWGGIEVPITALDYYLWRMSVELEGKGKLVPFHRCRTFCY